MCHSILPFRLLFLRSCCWFPPPQISRRISDCYAFFFLRFHVRCPCPAYLEEEEEEEEKRYFGNRFVTINNLIFLI